MVILKNVDLGVWGGLELKRYIIDSVGRSFVFILLLVL